LMNDKLAAEVIK